MSQNDFTLANQSFPSFRSDLNSALQALASNNSGTSAPSTTFANMWWYDSTNNILYIRNEDNDAWIQFATLDQANDLFVVTSSIDVGDNVKAKFGDSDDLQIYHDGNSQIINSVGHLNIDNNGDDKQINLRSDDGSGGIVNYIRVNGNTGAVQLYNYGSQKLATTSTGIDVTGTVTADGLTSAGNLNVSKENAFTSLDGTTGYSLLKIKGDSTLRIDFGTSADDDAGRIQYDAPTNNFRFYTDNTRVVDIDSNGVLLVGKTASNSASEGCELRNGQSGTGFALAATATADAVVSINRKTDDGQLVVFRQDNATEGNISVSGTVISYNGGHLARWSQLADNTRDNTIVKGTVMTNLDQMAEWTTDGVTEDNEQLNCMAVSSVEGDANVAGVFVNWDNDDDIYTNDMNVAMTGDMVIRIAQGTTVARGDLLMSAGDGTAKPQGDDIVRSKTIAKVTSTNVSHTYDDGTYLVPCVLMAC